jgi:hypothetical protein
LNSRLGILDDKRSPAAIRSVLLIFPGYTLLGTGKYTYLAETTVLP